MSPYPSSLSLFSFSPIFLDVVVYRTLSLSYFNVLMKAKVSFKLVCFSMYLYQIKVKGIQMMDRYRNKTHDTQDTCMGLTQTLSKWFITNISNIFLNYVKYICDYYLEWRLFFLSFNLLKIVTLYYSLKFIKYDYLLLISLNNKINSIFLM